MSIWSLATILAIAFLIFYWLKIYHGAKIELNAFTHSLVRCIEGLIFWFWVYVFERRECIMIAASLETTQDPISILPGVSMIISYA